jgi:signal transduction histidine kinase
MPDSDFKKLRAHIHDLNNALAPIVNYAEFLIEDLEGQEDVRDFARRIHAAGQEALALSEKIRAEVKNGGGDGRA